MDLAAKMPVGDDGLLGRFPEWSAVAVLVDDGLADDQHPELAERGQPSPYLLERVPPLERLEEATRLLGVGVVEGLRHVTLARHGSACSGGRSRRRQRRP